MLCRRVACVVAARVCLCADTLRVCVRVCVCVCVCLTNLVRALLWLMSVLWLWLGSVFVDGTAVWLDVFITPSIAKGFLICFKSSTGGVALDMEVNTVETITTGPVM